MEISVELRTVLGENFVKAIMSIKHLRFVSSIGNRAYLYLTASLT